MAEFKRLRPVLELFAWMALILYLSGDTFQSSRTLYALRYWSDLLGLQVSGATLRQLNFVIRKGAHFGEFFVLGVLAYRALTGTISKFSFSAVKIVLIGGTLFAMTDELRQYISGSRSGSAWDVLVDSCGIAASQVWIYLRSDFGKIAVTLRRNFRSSH